MCTPFASSSNVIRHLRAASDASERVGFARGRHPILRRGNSPTQGQIACRKSSVQSRYGIQAIPPSPAGLGDEDHRGGADQPRFCGWRASPRSACSSASSAWRRSSVQKHGVVDLGSGLDTLRARRHARRSKVLDQAREVIDVNCPYLSDHIAGRISSSALGRPRTGALRQTAGSERTSRVAWPRLHDHLHAPSSRLPPLSEAREMPLQWSRSLNHLGKPGERSHRLCQECGHATCCA
jgi:hypothetical protein